MPQEIDMRAAFSKANLNFKAISPLGAGVSLRQTFFEGSHAFRGRLTWPQEISTVVVLYLQTMLA